MRYSNSELKNLFRSTDYTFCNSTNCNKKDKCVRNVKHYIFDKKDWYSIFSSPNESECKSYIKGIKF
jgi:hypothetical protein